MSGTGVDYDAPDTLALEAQDRLADRHIVLLTDYDGTLADISPTPATAVIHPDAATGLRALAGLGSMTTGVVSGRRLDDVRRRTESLTEFVAGLHGLEIEGPGCAFRHDALDVVAPAIRELLARAQAALVWCPGLLLEDKTYALTCHVRQAIGDDAGRALEDFEALAAPWIEAGVLRMMTGLQSREVLPAVEWHKGRAASWIRSEVAARTRTPIAIIYLGDDRTDEDAFRALSGDDFAIAVGDRPLSQLAAHRLAGPSSVGRFLQRLAESRR
jgi:trehalose 6-phosphate phosphatase